MFRYLANHGVLDALGREDEPLVAAMRALDGRNYHTRPDLVQELNGVNERLQGHMDASEYVCGPIIGEDHTIKAYYAGERGIVSLGRISVGSIEEPVSV